MYIAVLLGVAFILWLTRIIPHYSSCRCQNRQTVQYGNEKRTNRTICMRTKGMKYTYVKLFTQRETCMVSEIWCPRRIWFLMRVSPCPTNTGTLACLDTCMSSLGMLMTSRTVAVPQIGEVGVMTIITLNPIVLEPFHSATIPSTAVCYLCVYCDRGSQSISGRI